VLKTLDDSLKRLEDALVIIDKRIEALVARLASDNNGRFISDSLSIKQAVNIRNEIAKIMLDYGAVVRLSSNDFIQASQAARDSFKGGTLFTESDALVIDAMSNAAIIEMIALGDAATSNMSDAVLQLVASGGSKSEAMLIVQQLTIGNTAKNGKPLLHYAKTITETAYMEVNAVSTLMLAERVNIDKFKYNGTLIGGSRSWCRQHVGKVFTRKEIEAWRGKSWSGKKSGDPFITRGGWNCRHWFTPYYGE